MASRTRRCDAAAVVEHLTNTGAAALRAFVERQRWFAAKARGLETARVEDWAALRDDPPIVLLLIRADEALYYVPVALGEMPPDAARTIGPLAGLALFDAHWHPDFGLCLLDAITSRRAFSSARGSFRCAPVDPWDHPSWDLPDREPARPHSGEQSNTSIFFDRRLILKSVRRLEAGINQDFEMLHFLASRPGFGHVPRLAGWVEYAGPGETTTVALLQQFVGNTGDGWTHTLAGLGSLCEKLAGVDSAGDVEPRVAALGVDLLADIHELGAVTGKLHAALASDPDLPAFRPERITGEDVGRWRGIILQDLERLAAEIAFVSAQNPAAGAALAPLLDARARIERADDLFPLADGTLHKIRCHGDYHLGQVLKTAESFVVIDFEGEPARPVEERRAKQCPLRDVAGMLRSFDYAAHAALAARPEAERARLRPALETWERQAARAFLDGYGMAAGKSPARLLPQSAEAARRACAAFELEKAFYELRYELNNRPDWIEIPLAGIARLLA
jgi:maltose alpha-D-glucosyltransferase / alpha-amylase